MRSSIFFFLGVTERGTDANINIFQERLEASLPDLSPQMRFEPKGDLVILKMSDPDFRFCISFANNDPQTRNEWKEFAKNFKLPWDMKPVDKLRLTGIYACLEEKGWSEYGRYQKLGFAILEVMEKFNKVKVFTIPSMEKSTKWGRIFEWGEL
jgi:hypothetical protein